MTTIDAGLRPCEKCGRPFKARSGSGGSVQRFCCERCRLSFHKERLRAQRTGSYAGQLPEPATQEPATVFEQAERLIAKLTPDECRRLIERLTTDLTIEPVSPVGGDDLSGSPEAPSGFETLAGPPR